MNFSQSEFESDINLCSTFSSGIKNRVSKLHMLTTFKPDARKCSIEAVRELTQILRQHPNISRQQLNKELEAIQSKYGSASYENCRKVLSIMKNASAPSNSNTIPLQERYPTHERSLFSEASWLTSTQQFEQEMQEMHQKQEQFALGAETLLQQYDTILGKTRNVVDKLNSICNKR